MSSQRVVIAHHDHSLFPKEKCASSKPDLRESSHMFSFTTSGFDESDDVLRGAFEAKLAVMIRLASIDDSAPVHDLSSAHTLSVTR